MCAAVDHKSNQLRNSKECVFGFFEYIEDNAVFEALLEHVLSWARACGLNALRGPFNLDYEVSYRFQPARGDNLAYEIKLDIE